MLIISTLMGVSTAHGAGYYFADIGVRSFSRGGAFIASADDLTAMYYNPAAIVRLDRPQLMLNVAGVQQFVNFQRTAVPGNGPLDDSGSPTDISYDPVENKAPPYAIPHFGFSIPNVLPRTTLAVGFYPPYAPDLSYPAQSSQRYSLVDTQVIQTAAGPSVAHRLNKWISFGAGISWNVLYADQELSISLPFDESKAASAFANGDDGWSMDPNEDRANDVDFRFDATDKQGIGWNAGLLIEPPSQRWALGLMMQAPTRFNAKGSMSADFSEHILYTEGALGQQVVLSKMSKDNSVEMNITMPLILKGGLALRGDTGLGPVEVELAGVWENWSSIEEITITDLNMVVDLNEEFLGGLLGIEDAVIDDDVRLPAGYTDAWSVRLGGQVDIRSKWTARAGAFYETSAIPSETQSVALIDGNKVGYGLGGSYRPSHRWAIDFGLSQSFPETRKITDSDVRQISVNPLTGDFLEGTTIGNGTYQSSLLIFGGGLNVFFGKEPASSEG